MTALTLEVYPMACSRLTRQEHSEKISKLIQINLGEKEACLVALILADSPPLSLQLCNVAWLVKHTSKASVCYPHSFPYKANPYLATN